ncbi:MAG: nascent polypeptide-associated complex protein [Candidatus ainarchaeum sp.]|nr:nascent polypeptide-associated complex protein [Candidatus ainarchaeum sp.]MDD3976342.1 nascent polypeptide-associated complex protein [Candidatus ainarchaeum sp.]
MFPNMGGLDPRRMQSMMKQMGIENKEISAKRVIIETNDSKIIILEPQVTKITMQGQSSFQISGDIQESKELIIPQEDIDMVSTQANISKEKAKKLLEETKGDIAKAISLIDLD